MDFTPGVSRNADGRAIELTRRRPFSGAACQQAYRAADLQSGSPPGAETLPPYAATAGKFVANRRA